ncbi:lipoyl(octanoyl) transferase LipB [Aurantibacillus circumpalustris]|uniref:lipoyl(octanoyl) transferase LipB n=1 Tax=Aurantibacillus circumpalustris TaxID=3036359 RepID=UPI00295B8455|nr:lipoyl(octanoyl) transferase LipB [Aurantibacillus circumpalustris]
MPANKTIIFQDLGVMDYKHCWDYQEELFNKTIQQKIANRNLPETEQTQTKNHLLFVEHPHVYTLGKSGDEKNLLLNEEALSEKAATYYKINRGGDITYHGPGQLVAYPILDLDNFFTDIHKYLRLLEETIILTLKEYGVESGRSAGETGVWLDAEDKTKARKICAMGVRCSRWVTMHGWGFNVNANLDYFNNIIPCGIQDKAVTSLNKELGKEVDMNEIKDKLKKNFTKLFGAHFFQK